MRFLLLSYFFEKIFGFVKNLFDLFGNLFYFLKDLFGFLKNLFDLKKTFDKKYITTFNQSKKISYGKALTKRFKNIIKNCKSDCANNNTKSIKRNG
jgi:hypothetical protein